MKFLEDIQSIYSANYEIFYTYCIVFTRFSVYFLQSFSDTAMALFKRTVLGQNKLQYGPPKVWLCETRQNLTHKQVDTDVKEARPCQCMSMWLKTMMLL